MVLVVVVMLNEDFDTSCFDLVIVVQAQQMLRKAPNI